VYTTNLTDPLDVIVRRQWYDLVGHEAPGCVITDRSAPASGPVDGVLYLAGLRNRTIELPGLMVSVRAGAPPLPDDVRLPGGLVLASRARALAENSRLSRGRGGMTPRTLNDAELGDWIDQLCQADGEQRLAQYRERAEEIADEVGAAKTIDRVSKLVGAALGSQRVDTAGPALRARQAGLPYDTARTERFDVLIAALRSSPPQSRTSTAEIADSYVNQSFFEAYFSNYIEGTTFEIDEARQIVFENRPVENRIQDSHDISGTFQLVADRHEMSRLADTGDQYIELLRHRHRAILGGRPDVRPGEFKEHANRAGQTQFVPPALVKGTLREGFARMSALDTSWERAVYSMFVIAEVHPFDDGNGRVARVMMNGELVAGGQSKIIVPTGYRDDYLGGLRRLSRRDDPSVLIKALRFLQDYTWQIDWSDFETAQRELLETNAFVDAEEGPRLRLPRPLRVDELTVDQDEPDPAPDFVASYQRNGRIVSGYRRRRR
jgi:hypothetical protein